MSAEPTPSPMILREGDVLDAKYRVERVLGQGGMGIVVAARHLQLDQRVALKLILPEALANPDAAIRFAREARAAGKLRSEHVARVLDVGRLPNGAPYMVMEYLEGADLGDVIDSRGALPAHEAVDYVLQACEAIAEAHSLGIVHRDLKPQNLFVTARVDGRPLVKVLDFGISKALDESGKEEMSLTRTQTVMGSPNYMSPEQLRSAKLVDARTDLWALGIILYESLTGRVPFAAETLTELCAMVLQDAPAPIEGLRHDVPPGLSQVIFACLEKDVSRRMPSVADLAQALERFGSAASAGVAMRIGAVSRASLPPERSSKRVPVSGGTSVAWGETQLAPPKKRGAWVIGAAIALMVIAIAAFVRFRIVHAAATDAQLELVPSTRQIELALPPEAPSAATTIVASPPVLSAAPALPASAPMPTATHRAPLTVPPAARAPSTSRPKAHASDDMPDERN